MSRSKLLVVALVAGWMAACGDGGDRDAACKEEKELAAKIAQKAEETDGISARDLCSLTQPEIAQRLQASPVWGSATEDAIAERARQYVANCEKLVQAKADCGD